MKISVTLILAASEAKALSRKTARWGREAAMSRMTVSGTPASKQAARTPAVHPVDGAAADHPAGVGQVDAQAQVQQAGIEQIQVGAVLPDIGHRLPDQRLGYLLRGIEDLLPAALVHPEDPEAMSGQAPGNSVRI